MPRCYISHKVCGLHALAVAEMQSLLEVCNISKRFGGLQALDDVSFSVPEKCIYGVIGPNGAGKTSLFNIITGLYQADTGKMLLYKKNILNAPPHNIVEQGIARTFQNIRRLISVKLPL